MGASHRTVPAVPHIPRYALYDEPLRPIDARFIHVETIASRSEPRDWTIRTHAHHDLHQLLLIRDGGGAMRAETEQWRFGACSLLIAPAGLLHGFDFEPGTDGHILSLADTLARTMATTEPALGTLLGAARVASIGTAADAIQRRMAELALELADARPMRGSAAAAMTTLILVATARAIGASEGGAHADPGREADLVARFRAQIEARLGEGWSAGEHARALGISLSRLRAACSNAAGEAPVRMIRQRTMTEARRLLAHGSAPVSTIAYALGFSDAAYFSRWFARAEGRSAGAYREAMRAKRA